MSSFGKESCGWTARRSLRSNTPRLLEKRQHGWKEIIKYYVHPLAPNDVYIRRTAQLTSRRCILNIYSTNILSEYFKHGAHSPFFSLQDAVYFIMLPFFGSCNIHILNTGCAKI